MYDFFYQQLMAPELKSRSDLVKKMQEAEPLIYDEIVRIHSMGFSGIVAGGFASYLLGLTSGYSDVDFFCHEANCTIKLMLGGDYHYAGEYYEISVDGLVINHNRLKLQVICIPSVKFTGIAYYAELIRCFDVPACQKGFFVILPGRERFGVDPNTTYYIDQNHPFLNVNIISLDKERLANRILKYANRFVNSGEVESLRSLCQGAIRKQDPNYKMLRFGIDCFERTKRQKRM